MAFPEKSFPVLLPWKKFCGRHRFLLLFGVITRELCLFSAPVLDGGVSDGASLVYTSVKEMKNLDVLYKYLVHRLYGFPFHCSAQVVERDAVFM